MERDAQQVETPIRPTLQRQNAMPAVQQQPVGPEVFVINRPGAFAMLTCYIQDAMEEDGLVEPAEPNLRLTHNHVLLPFHTALEEDWQCSICSFAVVEGNSDLVLHPSNCHFYHRTCLSDWLYNCPMCPLCNASGAPLLMKSKTC